MTNTSFYKDSAPMEFTTVATALHIGTKFQFLDIRDEALARLAICFPETLEAFYSNALVVTHHRPKDLSTTLAQCPIDFEDDEGDAIAVFHLARSLNLLDILPAAIYCCAQLPIPVLFAAYQSLDTTYSLTLAELQECLEARVELQKDTISLYRWIAAGETSAECIERDQDGDSLCNSVMMDLAAYAHDQGFLDHPDALSTLEEFLEGCGKSETPLCTSCTAWAKQRHQEQRKEIWSRLRTRYISEPVSNASLAALYSFDRWDRMHRLPSGKSWKCLKNMQN